MSKFRYFFVILLAAAFAGGCTPQAKTARHLARGDKFLESGDFESARIEFSKALRTDPKNATAYAQLGAIWSDRGAPLRAMPFLVKARDLAPEQIAPRVKLADTFLSLGFIGEARTEALAVLERSPANGDALLVLAQTSVTKEYLAETEQQLEKFPARGDVHFLLASANVAMQKDDLPAAQTAVAQALQTDPGSALAHLSMANLALRRNEPKVAGEEFQKAEELAPLRSAVRLRFAEYEANSGAMQVAKASLQDLAHKAPDYLPASILLARFASSEKKYDEALSTLEPVLQQDSSNLDALLLQAEVWLAKGDIDKAVEGLQRLNADYPKLPTVKYQFARALFAQGKVEPASKALGEAIALNPDSAESIILLAEINLRSGQSQPAVDALAPLLQKHPELANASLLLAAGYRNLGRLDDAAAVFRQQIQRFPKDPHGYFLLGMILRQQKKSAEARAAFTKAQELGPTDLPTTFQLVELDLADQDFKSALQKAQDQIQKQPKSSSAEFLEAKVYAAQKNWPLAEAALHKALELDPNSSSASDLLLGIYVSTGRLPDAIQQSETVAAAHPNDVKTLLELATMYQANGQLPKAQETYEKLLAIRSDVPRALNNLACIYADQPHQLDKAAELAKKAQALRPTDSNIADTYGWILYRKGDYQGAAALLQESVAGNVAKDPAIEFHLGMALCMMGQTEAARKYLHEAAAAAADFPQKADISARLALLEDSAGKAREPSVEELTALSAKQPDDALVWMLLGDAYQRKNAPKLAVDAYQQALKLNPKQAANYAKLAVLYAGPLHDADQALKFAQKARELAPADPVVAGMIGRAALQIGNFSWAYSLLQESFGAAPNDTALLEDLALAAYALGRVADSRKEMEQIVATGSNSPQYRDAAAFLAMTAYEGTSKDLDPLAPRAEEILEDDPFNAPALLVRAAAQVSHGDRAAAEATYTAILSRAPDFVPGQKALATFYADQPEKRAAAYDLAVKARKSLPDDPELAQLLAELSYHRHEFDYAEQLFKGSADKKPLSPKYLYYLGMAEWKNKEKPQSQETLKKALAAGLPESLVTEAKGALADLDAKK